MTDSSPSAILYPLCWCVLGMMDSPWFGCWLRSGCVYVWMCILGPPAGNSYTTSSDSVVCFFLLLLPSHKLEKSCVHISMYWLCTRISLSPASLRTSRLPIELIVKFIPDRLFNYDGLFSAVIARIDKLTPLWFCRVTDRQTHCASTWDRYPWFIRAESYYWSSGALSPHIIGHHVLYLSILPASGLHPG